LQLARANGTATLKADVSIMLCNGGPDTNLPILQHEAVAEMPPLRILQQMKSKDKALRALSASVCWYRFHLGNIN
jgi:hypothetical protein